MTSPSQIDYPTLVTEALRSVVARVLQPVAEEGLPGGHFFYIAFRTDHAGVEIPLTLQQQYPQEMTIVLQNEFSDLYADDDLFAVTLRFDGVAQRLVVPYDALNSFVDPAAEFALRFHAAGDELEPGSDGRGEAPAGAAREVEPPTPMSDSGRGQRSAKQARDTDSGEGASVVQLDAFRKP